MTPHVGPQRLFPAAKTTMLPVITPSWAVDLVTPQGVSNRWWLAAIVMALQIIMLRSLAVILILQ